MNTLSHTVEALIVASASDKCHECGCVVDKPDTSPLSKVWCEFQESYQHHQELQLGYVDILLAPYGIQVPGEDDLSP